MLQFPTYLGWCRYEIMHFRGEENCRRDLLSRWRRADTDADGEASGSVGCFEAAAYTSADTVYALPSKTAIKSSQLTALAAEDPVDEVATSCGIAQ